MLHKRLGTTCFITHAGFEYSSSGRRWTCLSVDQVKALPYIVAFPIQRFLPITGKVGRFLPKGWPPSSNEVMVESVEQESRTEEAQILEYGHTLSSLF